MISDDEPKMKQLFVQSITLLKYKVSFCCYYFLSFGLADASYSDPLGPQVERPKTAARRREDAADDFADEELDEDLLPD